MARSPVKTPGEPQDTEAAADAAVAAASMDDGSGNVVMTKAELDAALARAVAQGAAMASAPRKPPAEEALPDQSELDPAKLKSMTLSKQGWVVPHGLGEPAAEHLKR